MVGYATLKPYHIITTPLAPNSGATSPEDPQDTLSPNLLSGSVSIRICPMKRVSLAVYGVFIGFAPPVAQAGKIYWCDRNVGLVQRANLDGSEIETLIEVNATLRGIAIDVAKGKLYFANQTAGKIFGADIDGSGVAELVSGLRFPADVHLDSKSGKVYWCDQSRSVIERANLDGSGVEVVVETPQPYYLDLDPTNRRLFWGDFTAGNINYVSLDGGEPVNVLTGQRRVRGVKLDLARGEMVWCNRESNHIQGRKIEGGSLRTVIEDLDTPHGLAIDPVARKAYWCDTGTDNHHNGGKAINRTDLDVGGALETVAKLSQPWDADLDLRTTTYSQYMARFFRMGRTETETAFPGDFDGDGFVQLLEYGLASHPERKDIVPEYEVGLGANELVFTYKRFQGAADLTYEVEVSDGLKVWRSNSADEQVTGDEAVELLAHGLERVSLPVLGSGSYLRLRVTLEQ